jgi:putative ABC transport system permease protein
MRYVRAWLLRLAGLFDKQRRDLELDDELRCHLEMEVAENLSRGMSVAEAHRQALVRLGAIEPAKERYRDRRGVPILESLVRDVRFSLRSLSKSPGFTAVTLITLGLGIGANTAIFSIVNAVLLRPLPYPEAGNLVMVWATDSKRGVSEDVASYPTFEDWKSQAKSFQGLAAFSRRGMILAGDGEAEMVPAMQTTADLFELLGTLPAMGRTFEPEESEPGAQHVVVLSDSLWKQRFAGRPDIIGSTLRLDEQAHTIIGVMPAGFKFSDREAEQVYVPLQRDPDRGHGFLLVIGRLRHGTSISLAQSEMDTITHQLAEQHPGSNRTIGANIQPLVDAMVGKVRTGLWILLGVVALVLLIACTNVANLMLARSSSRRKELAVRAALGAGRGRLARQLLTESMMLAIAGGALGLALSSAGRKVLVSMLSMQFHIPRVADSRTDAWVLAFTLLVSVLTGVLFGIFPALSRGPDLNEALRESSRSATESRQGKRVRGLLVVIETALALILLASAGLLFRNFVAMRSTTPGFKSERLLTVDFRLPRHKFAGLAARARFLDDLETQVSRAPGVQSAALVADLPLGGGLDSQQFHIVGRQDPEQGYFQSNFNMASAGYCQTMGIPVLAGREFADQDKSGTPLVVVINQTAARQFWKGEDPVGKQIILPLNDTNLTLTVAGVIGDVRQASLGREPRPEIFLNYMQSSLPWTWLVMVVRTIADAEPMSGTIKSLASSVDPDVPVSGIETMDQVLSQSVAEPRTYTILLGFFSLLAVGLAAVGLYGVISYNVTERTHEMGIRMALGAERRQVLRLVIRQGLSLSAVGTAIGVPGAIAGTRLLTSLVATVKVGDPVTLGAIVLVLFTVATAACIVPALRAMRVDPMSALRYE